MFFLKNQSFIFIDFTKKRFNFYTIQLKQYYEIQFNICLVSI